jgi:hypothetical protein
MLCFLLTVAVTVSVLFAGRTQNTSSVSQSATLGYETELFDTSKPIEINIIIDLQIKVKG